MALEELLDRIRKSRTLVLVVVFFALMLDNILLTVVVPIVPEFIITLEQDAADRRFFDLLFNQTHSSDNITHLEQLYLNLTSSSTDLFGNNNNDTGLSPVDDPILIPEQALNENSRVGWLFSSKAIVQLLANSFVGTITNRYGSIVPMFSGVIILILSAILYAFGETYAVLFVARSIHGLSSSCTAIAGMSMLADTYPDDKDRSKAMGVALGGIALGVLIGYPFGGCMYQFVGKMAPFLIIALLGFVEGGLQLWVLQPSMGKEKAVVGTSLTVLLKDPYILVASGAILFPEMAMAMLEPTLPIWLIDTMNPEKWQLGIIFIPDSIGYLIGCNAFGTLAVKIGRWRCTMVSLALMGTCLFFLPFATKMIHLIIPHFGLGLALGMADVSVMPLLAYLVDRRHVAVYGTVYAIAQVSISLGFALGPSLGGLIVKSAGFPWLIRGMALANFLYVPFCYFLKDIPSREENKSILMNDQVQQTYTENETFNYSRLEED